MHNKKQAMHHQLRFLRTQYVFTLPIKVDQLRQCWNQIQSNSGVSQYLDDFSHLAHNIAGSGSTFGCPEVSALAQKIDNLCRLRRDNDADRPASAQMEKLLLELKTASLRALERGLHQHAEFESVTISAQTDSNPPLIYIVEDDRLYAENIAATIKAAGYEIKILERIDALSEAAMAREPDVIIMDMMLAEGEFAGARAAAHYTQERNIPVIFLSMRNDVAARLAAIRAGASQYFTKPVDTIRLIAELDRLTIKPGTSQYRILLVDDDLDFSALYTKLFEVSGMQTLSLHDPAAALPALETYEADLIVLDVEMPIINGLELGALIRQMDQYSHIPIVFLSADTSTQTRLAGLHLGADDFLSKLISPNLLVEALKARAARARILRDGRSELQRAIAHMAFIQSALDAHAIVAMTDLDGHITYANKKFAEISGYNEAELLGQNHHAARSEQHPPTLYDELWNTISSGHTWHGTLSNRAKNGDPYESRATIMPKLDDSGLPVQYIEISTDITELQTLERSVAAEAERLNLALQATESGIWEWNLATGQTLYSESWKHLLGYADVEISWSQLIHAEDFEAAFHALLQHIDGHAATYISEHRIRNRQGGWLWVREMGKVVERDAAGDPIRFVGITKCIDERIAFEQQQRLMQEKLAQAAKMESIGQLASGIAHDFNNLLGSMLGYTELSADLIGTPEKADKIKHYLAQVLAAGNRAKELISQMLMFSRFRPTSDTDEAPVILLQPIVKEVVYLLRSSLPSTLQVNYHIQDADLRARIQPVHLHQILFNLVINARDAMNEYGEIDITQSQRTVQGHCDSCHAEFAGDYVALDIQDSGSGIPEHVLAKVFDPFFTTKEVGKGTGMGLSVVHGIVHTLNGHITVSSTTRGTTLRILLPTVNVAATEVATETTPPALSAGALDGLRIMVVDDERAMATMLHEVLTLHGAQVDTYTQPRAALAAFERDPACVEMVITDATMPELSGLDLAKAILQLHPNLPILLCTGYSEHVDPEIAHRQGIAGFMQKPLDLSKLLAWIQEHAGAQKPKAPN